MVRVVLTALAAVLLSAAAQAADLDVTVRGVRNDQGHVRVTVCTRPEFLADRCTWSGLVPARTGAVTVHFSGIPPGTYAVQVFHDENDNGRLDRNLLGIPTEGIGFSRDAPVHFGPPAWPDAAFQLSPTGGVETLTLHYL